MFVHDTNHKGNVAELAIAAEAARLGLSVLKPLTEHEPYDLAFDLGFKILRVQCKWARRENDVVLIHIGKSRRSRNGFVRSTYREDQIDALAAYCQVLDRCYLLPIGMVAGRHAVHLRISAARNNQKAAVNFAADYELGAVAQLEERRHGMAEAEGSSPSSSIIHQVVDRFDLSFPARDRFPDLKETVGMDEFDAKLAQYVRRAEAGDEVHITRWGRPVATLGPHRARR